MKTILLIEDNLDIRENTCEILELAGYKVIEAENGKVGVAKAMETHPDLVICDIMMPVLDGYGVLHIFSRNPDLARIPFIFLTAKTERTDFRKGMELGADDFLTKPFEESELLKAIEGRLSRFEQLDQVRIRADYDLNSNGLQEFLDDVQLTVELESLSVDRKSHFFPKKQYIYTEGDRPSRVYFVRKGTVKTIKMNPEGKEFITGLYGPGTFFGYLSVLEKMDYADSAVCLEDTELIYIPQTDFEQLLWANKQISHQFIRMLAGRVIEREQQLLTMAYSSLRRRVANMLLQLNEQASEETKVIRFSRDDLASMIGIATESLIRTLSEFKQDGLIEISGSSIRVLQAEKLRRANW